MKNKFRLGSLLMVLTGLFSCTNNESARIEQAVQNLTDSLVGVHRPDKRTVRLEVQPVWLNKQLILKGESSDPTFFADYQNELQKLDIKAIDSVNLLPHASLGQNTWGLITVSVANLRGEPGHSQELVTQALMGTPVRVLKKEGGWYYIQTPDNYLSWVDEAALISRSDAELKTWNENNRIIFLGDYEIIHESMEPGSPAVSDLVLGAILTQKNSQGSYLQVVLPDGREGFLRKEHCENFDNWKQAVYPDPDQLIERGREMLGRPYLWGGTSAKGMDCSGFVKTLYFTGGLLLPRDASQQVHTGIPIQDPLELSNLLKGDLLFFGRKASAESKERITHVGMYIGGGKYIHASGRVKINSLNPADPDFSQYLVDLLVSAKRMIAPADLRTPQALVHHPWYN